jgi:hypothetical protein
MAQIVQAKCPGCHKTLRVPSDWVHKKLKCKHCGLVLQAKPAPSAVPPAAAADRFPVGRPVEAPPSLDRLEDLLPPANEPGAIIRTPYRRRSGCRWWKVGIAGTVLVALAGLLGYFIKSRLPPAEQVAGALGLNDAGTAAGNGDAPATQVKPSVKGDLPTDAWCPRRALLICVSNYLYANPVGYGVSAGRPGQNLNTLAQRLSGALRIPPDQVVELSDGAPERLPTTAEFPAAGKGKGNPKRAPGKNAAKITAPRDVPKAPSPSARPTVKPVLERTISDFLAGCRAQDRILLLFAGHAVEINDQPYLVPLEGNLTAKDTLIPLKWVYDRLAACKARQKVLILDVCRFDPARGLERPGSGPMGAKLDAALKAPPEGVQVWTSCVAGEYGHEFDGSSVFLDKLFDALGTGGALQGIQQPRDPLPLAAMIERVGKTTTKEVQDELKVQQTPRLTGQEPKDGADFDPREPAPPQVVIQPPPVPGGSVADPREMKKLLDEIRVPPIKRPRAEAAPLPLETLLPFPAKVLEDYKADYVSIREFLQIPGKRERYPLRAAVVDAVDLLQKYADTKLVESFRARTTDQVKTAVLEIQREPARVIGDLQDGLDALRKAGEKREEEKSARWQAHYDYVLAQLLARLAYVHEYNLMLGRFRQERLPELNPAIHGGWRLASREKLQSPKETRDLATESHKILDKLMRKHPGTPWEVLAGQAKLTALGLEWQPSR